MSHCCLSCKYVIVEEGIGPGSIRCVGCTRGCKTVRVNPKLPNTCEEYYNVVQAIKDKMKEEQDAKASSTI